MDKTGVKLVFVVDVMKSKRQVKRKACSRGSNCYFPFAVNVILNQSKKHIRSIMMSWRLERGKMKKVLDDPQPRYSRNRALSGCSTKLRRYT